MTDPTTARALRLWERYRRLLCTVDEVGLSLDVSRIRFDDAYLTEMAPTIASALAAMADLEGGATANADEARAVGHYWLRAPQLAPGNVGASVVAAREAIVAFAGAVRAGRIRGAGGSFLDLIHVGIGGSALGPQLLCEAIREPHETMDAHFLDNADPDSVSAVLRRLRGGLARTLVLVTSKSGATPTPLHVARALQHAYRDEGLSFAAHAVAITMDGTALHAQARAEGWLTTFPLWDWVGGRTSVTSAVGLLPAAVLGGDIGAFLDGAAAMDRRTRRPGVATNPAALLALMWFWAGSGRDRRNMVVLPYKDRLALLSRYVQQLVMESVGKRRDRRGRVVWQGMTVYGHKGSTDQHSIGQQLRDGPADFFVTFIRVRGEERPYEIEDSISLGDHLFASAVGMRDALYERGRDSITITVPDAGPRSLGALVALFERATGLYAELIDVNAYNQPGVDKYVAGPTIDLQRSAVAFLAGQTVARTAADVAGGIGCPQRVEGVFALLDNLAAQPGRGVARVNDSADPALITFRWLPELSAAPAAPVVRAEEEPDDD